MLDRAVEILARLVSFPTVSADSNLELIDYATQLLGPLGAGLVTTTNPEGTKANLFATLGPTIDGGVVLSGHTDVVPVEGQEWTRNPFLAEVAEDRVWGRGTTDMKGFLACALAMAPRFAEARLERPVHLALTYDEEEGCHGAKVMLEELARSGPHPSAAIVGEPTEFEIVIAHKGCYEFTTEIHGVERHASMSAAGAGAIHAAVSFIGELDRLADELATRAPADSPFDPPATTINVGTIAGGVARNITAGSTVFDWEMRPVEPGDADFVLERMDRFVEETLLPKMREEFPEATITTSTVGAVGEFSRRPEGPGVALAQRLTGNQELSVVSFGTEAGLFQELGIATVVCGPGSLDQAHKPDEFIELDQLQRCLTVMERLLAELRA
jgi:acetylornithine deacetylase